MYPMYCFKFPKQTCRDLDRMIANFWWNEGKEGRKIHWKAWSSMTRSKKDGGMGFRDFEAMNDALLAKTAWRLMNNEEEMWVKVLKGVYYPNTPFMNAKIGHKASWLWSSILDGRNLLKENTFWKVGDGKRVNVWFDRWILEMKRRLADIVNVPEEAKKWIVSDLIIDGRWNMSNLQPLIFVEILQKICSIGSDHFQRTDELIWDKTKNGLYVVKKGYVEARSRRNVIDGRARSSFSLPNDIWN
ncbi:uncharacterized protein LOC114727377 [Neltuma alba]|uniref:uncharacterized protein LOC114727377 n=1 Tax=Neltuma alba TaxID=207710 RepID=UPI0010A48998|nr:uncharacterized protein LOC114727377 [Prosopis alba]